jgi:thiamine biosynthesis lipoprotein
VLVSLGGDIAVSGTPPSGGWPVLVTDNHAQPVEAPGQTIAIESGGLATSSTMVRRWKRGDVVMHHLVDPRTGRPAAPWWRTVSVTAANCVDANIAATAAIILGPDAPVWLERLGLPARLVGVDGTVQVVGSWPP